MGRSSRLLICLSPATPQPQPYRQRLKSVTRGEGNEFSKVPLRGGQAPDGCDAVEFTQMRVLRRKSQCLTLDQTSGYFSVSSATHFQELTMGGYSRIGNDLNLIPPPKAMVQLSRCLHSHIPPSLVTWQRAHNSHTPGQPASESPLCRHGDDVRHWALSQLWFG